MTEALEASSQSKQNPNKEMPKQRERSGRKEWVIREGLSKSGGVGLGVEELGLYRGIEVLFTINPKKNIGPKRIQITEPHFFIFLFFIFAVFTNPHN
jgi:hypothetical protein